MRLSLSISLLEFYTIIDAVLSQNIFVGPCLENPSPSRMEEIYLSDLAPENTATNSTSVDLVDTVACSLI